MDIRTIDIACPFCGDTEFDLPGLKDHLGHGRCDAYEAVEVVKMVWDRLAEKESAKP